MLRKNAPQKLLQHSEFTVILGKLLQYRLGAGWAGSIGGGCFPDKFSLHGWKYELKKQQNV